MNDQVNDSGNESELDKMILLFRPNILFEFHCESIDDFFDQLFTDKHFRVRIPYHQAIVDILSEFSSYTMCMLKSDKCLFGYFTLIRVESLKASVAANTVDLDLIYDRFISNLDIHFSHFS